MLICSQDEVMFFVMYCSSLVVRWIGYYGNNERRR